MDRRAETNLRPLLVSALALAGLLLLARPAPAQQEPPTLPPLERYSIIEDKNLFHPDRIPQMPPAGTGPRGRAFVEETPERFELHGVILREEGKSIALLREPNLTERKVKSFAQGDQVGPYLLKAVKSDRVVLSLGEREFEVSLYQPKTSTPPTPPPAALRPPTQPNPRIRPRPRPRPQTEP